MVRCARQKLNLHRELRRLASYPLEDERVASPARFERAAFRSVAECSIQLSYGDMRTMLDSAYLLGPLFPSGMFPVPFARLELATSSLPRKCTTTVLKRREWRKGESDP